MVSARSKKDSVVLFGQPITLPQLPLVLVAAPQYHLLKNKRSTAK